MDGVLNTEINDPRVLDKWIKKRNTKGKIEKINHNSNCNKGFD